MENLAHPYSSLLIESTNSMMKRAIDALHSKKDVKACLHYKTVRTRFRRSRFQNVFMRPHWNRLHVMHTCTNSLIYHVSLPNNRVMYCLQLCTADNGADSSCSCVLLSSIFSPRICHCTTEEGESGYEEEVVLT